MPSYPNEEGTAFILSSKGVIDYFVYSEDLHSQLLDDVDGISLERVSFEEDSNNPNNWKSAVASVGYATPGYLNSNAKGDIGNSGGQVTVEPKVIIPDGSGQNDFATISYNFANAGKVANVSIYDLSGRRIKSLAENYFLGTQGFFTWDGLDENGGKVRIGYYLILFELFDQSGNTETIKKKVVVGSRF